MSTQKAEGPVAVICPGCGGAAARTVAETCADPESRSSGLTDRLARSPGAASRSDSVTHFVEGMVLTFIGAALAYEGVRSDKPLYTIGGSLLAILLFVGTIVVIRGEARDRSLTSAGKARTDRLWRTASYCPSCASVFFPGGSPWQGLLTPEQFKKYIWTEAGFAEQLEEKDKDVALPPGLPAIGPGGTPDHV
ncbi:hypothetical protein [Streptomyces graminofaciens]|uniref:hypothetical protein n=1 Tax=Streptomyces graminofaciens TaxID=68212 RepID=UPI0033058E2B